MFLGTHSDWSVPPFPLNVVGWFPITVLTIVPPPLSVVVITVVMNEGVLVVSCPALLVVVITTVDFSVILNQKRGQNSSKSRYIS